MIIIRYKTRLIQSDEMFYFSIKLIIFELHT